MSDRKMNYILQNLNCFPEMKIQCMLIIIVQDKLYRTINSCIVEVSTKDVDLKLIHPGTHPYLEKRKFKVI